MAEKTTPKADKLESVESTVRTIRRATRKKYSAEEKIRIVLEVLRGETSLPELCRREGIPLYRFNKGGTAWPGQWAEVT